jgi:hypothetical protein
MAFEKVNTMTDSIVQDFTRLIGLLFLFPGVGLLS